MAKADMGQEAPDFELEGTDGRFRLSEHRGRDVVLLFYPGDNTPVCTRQFCSYAKDSDDLAALDAVVVGISPQDVSTHQAFRATHNIPVPLLADPGGRVAGAYGATLPLLGTRRGVIIVDEHGRIAHRDVHTLGLGFRDVGDIRRALQAVRPVHETPS